MFAWSHAHIKVTGGGGPVVMSLTVTRRRRAWGARPRQRSCCTSCRLLALKGAIRDSVHNAGIYRRYRPLFSRSAVQHAAPLTTGRRRPAGRLPGPCAAPRCRGSAGSRSRAPEGVQRWLMGVSRWVGATWRCCNSDQPPQPMAQERGPAASSTFACCLLLSHILGASHHSSSSS